MWIQLTILIQWIFLLFGEVVCFNKCAPQKSQVHLLAFVAEDGTVLIRWKDKQPKIQLWHKVYIRRGTFQFTPLSQFHYQSTIFQSVPIWAIHYKVRVGSNFLISISISWVLGELHDTETYIHHSQVSIYMQKENKRKTDR